MALSVDALISLRLGLLVRYPNVVLQKHVAINYMVLDSLELEEHVGQVVERLLFDVDVVLCLFVPLLFFYLQLRLG